jgi:Arc/MetJ family transcription regulator
MAMTSVDVDPEVLAKVGEVLGTTTKRDTINEALHEVLRIHAANRLMEMLQGDAMEIVDPDEVRDKAWGYSAGRQAA